MTAFTRKQKKTLRQIIISVVLFIIGMIITKVFDIKGYYALLPILPAYILIGWDVLYCAVREIGRGRLFGETFLMSVATLGALAIGEYAEGVAVMLFYKVGEVFESCAQTNAKKAIKDLAKLCPDSANIEKDGNVQTLGIDEVEIGDIMVVMPGERVALDGVIISGSASFDTSAMTGESLPAYITNGGEVLSGFICTDSKVKIKVTRRASESSSARVIALMEEAASKKSKSEDFIYRFSVIYTPIVVFAAIIIAVLPPLIIKDASYTSFIHRALSFLVVSCPCALVISVPLTYFTAVGRAAKKGIIFKSNEALEKLAKVKTAAFDKTGTLTSGEFRIIAVKTVGISEKELLSVACALEASSNHPIAKAIVKEYKERNPGSVPALTSDLREVRGAGIEARLNGDNIILGNLSFVSEKAIDKTGLEKSVDQGATSVHILKNDQYIGSVYLADKVKDKARKAVKSLSSLGVKSVMLTGDSASCAQSAASDVGIDEYYAHLLPQDKVKIAEELKKNGMLAFAGDGFNDAPVISCADVGFAMGGMGSDVAIEAADAVITDDDPGKVAWAVKLARFSGRIVKENVFFALLVKFSVLVLASFDIVGMWWAVFADVGVSVIAILNAMRKCKD